MAPQLSVWVLVVLIVKPLPGTRFAGGSEPEDGAYGHMEDEGQFC